jgi:hypothetical protein
VEGRGTDARREGYDRTENPDLRGERTDKVGEGEEVREREREGESSRGRALRDLGRFGIRFVAEKVRGWRADDKQTCSSGIGGKRDRSDGAGTQRFDGELVSREPLRAEIET